MYLKEYYRDENDQIDFEEMDKDYDTAQEEKYEQERDDMKQNKIMDIIKSLVDYNFKVYHIPDTNYCYYTLNDKIAYTQVDDLGIQTVSSVRKPTKLYGSGTRVGTSNNMNKEQYMLAFNYHYSSIPDDLWFKNEAEWIKQAYRGKDMIVYMQ